MKTSKSDSEGAGSFRSRCRAARLPLTVQRLAVYEVLSQTTRHPTADWIYEKVRKNLPHISRTSVFRILDTFSTRGLIKKIETPGSAAHYDSNIERHCHTFCDECGAIGDWFDAPFDRISCPDRTSDGFFIDEFSFSVRGLCARCAAKARKAPKTKKSELSVRRGGGE